MKNLSIAKKLMVAFGGCLLILCVVSGLALYTQSNMNDMVSELGTKRIPRMVAINELAKSSADYRMAEAKQILALTPDANAAAAKDAADALAAIDSRITMLNEALTVPIAIEKFENFKQKWAVYLASSKPVFAAATSNDTARATALFNGRDSINYHEALVTLNDSKKIQDELIVENRARADMLSAQGFWITLAGVGFALVSVGVLLVLLIRGIAAPLHTMSDAMGELAAGNMNAQIPSDPRKDEIGTLSNAMLAFRGQLRTAEESKQAQTDLIVGSIGTGLEALAQGDLTYRIDAELTGPFAKLKNDFNGAMHSVSDTLGAVNRSTASIRTGSNEISQASDDLSRRTEQQAASLEETAAAMDEITATVRETASGAIRANQVVADTRTDAEEGGRVVREAVTAMGGIERASNEISEIISVIDGIAFQTNLLALNAGVEAARAGDAGRGFAVVASEVRALAQRSAEAAKDVKTKIMASTGQVESGVTLVGETGRALERIVGRIGEISQLVSAIATSAEQQASGLQQVNTAVGEMDSVTQQNAAMVEESTAAARSLAAEAEDLARHVARFRMGEDHGFAGATAHAAPERSAPRNATPAPRKIVAARRPTAAAPQTRGALALKVEPDADDWSSF